LILGISINVSALFFLGFIFNGFLAPAGIFSALISLSAYFLSLVFYCMAKGISKLNAIWGLLPVLGLLILVFKKDGFPKKEH
jgi:hypothetical protein